MTIRRLISYFFFLSLMLLCGEVASRIGLAITYNSSFIRPWQVEFWFYPELKAIADVPRKTNDNTYDILLLGGSALTSEFGSVENSLQELAPRILAKKVRILNAARKAHTSRDSLIKYSLLADRHFDAVVLYQGINDIRMNYCPDEIYKDDYSHFSWYEGANLLLRHGMLRYTALPFAIDISFAIAKDRLGLRAHVPEFSKIMPELWHSYGEHKKNIPAFSKNLKAIVELAYEKQELILLPTYAYYIPANYSLRAFRNKSLDYGKHVLPLEIYGDAKEIPIYLSAYETEKSRLCREFPNARCVDANSEIPKGADYFDDVCHLTRKGSKIFAELVLSNLKAQPHPP